MKRIEIRKKTALSNTFHHINTHTHLRVNKFIFNMIFCCCCLSLYVRIFYSHPRLENFFIFKKKGKEKNIFLWPSSIHENKNESRREKNPRLRSSSLWATRVFQEILLGLIRTHEEMRHIFFYSYFEQSNFINLMHFKFFLKLPRYQKNMCINQSVSRWMRVRFAHCYF